MTRMLAQAADAGPRRRPDSTAGRFPPQWLAATEQRLRVIWETSLEALLVVDDERRYVSVNGPATELLGAPAEHLIGRRIDDFTARENWDVLESLWADFKGQGHQHGAYEVLRPDGSRAMAEYRGTWDFGPGQHLLVALEMGVRRGRVWDAGRWSGPPRGQTQPRARWAPPYALSWRQRIREALAEDRLVIHAQPIIDLASGATVKHELLVRMLDRAGGMIMPTSFLPAAEESGLIVDVDRWVGREAVRLASLGHAVNVNLSAHSLATPDLVDDFRSELGRRGADPSLIVIELTETAFVDAEQATTRFVEGLKVLGCRLALDDFGTGYGCFSYLKRLPVDYLKIDTEFVCDLPSNESSRHIVKAVVSLARAFGQETVAEGVEDDETLRILRDLGVDHAQGYAIGRPAPLVEALGQPTARRR